ncbi:hypothetical protein GCM10009120_31700 [Sphingobacterium siyangense subsp. cladoniae]|uniref:hypothetical protein n=1 Tax=Sphingobacterium siyangense TaxID=459529 RepID=UPI0031F80744
MRANYYYKKYGISQAELESISAKSKKDCQSISNDKTEIHPRILISKRKDYKKSLALEKSKIIKKISGKPNPWNKDDLKKSPWIYKK